MTILVTGSTGTIGSRIVERLAGQGADVRALSRAPDEAEFPDGVKPIRGDLLDVQSVRKALDGIDTLFLLVAVVPDELTQALLTLSLAREAGIRRYVYFSVLHAERFADVPHFATKHAVERMLAEGDLPASVLRPGYFFQNDAAAKPAIMDKGIYPMAIGGRGVAMVDADDIADIAVHELLRRENAPAALPATRIDIAGPEALTGLEAAAMWTDALGRPVAYAGDDLEAVESQLVSHMPGWSARDLRLMLARFQSDGLHAAPQVQEEMTRILGREPARYRDFVAATASDWTT